MMGFIDLLALWGTLWGGLILIFLIIYQVETRSLNQRERESEKYLKQREKENEKYLKEQAAYYKKQLEKQNGRS